MTLLDTERKAKAALIKELRNEITKLTERVDELFYENVELKKQLETLAQS